MSTDAEVDPYAELVTDPRNLRLRSESGRVNDPDPVVSFMYGLMRDHFPVGEVERMVRDVEDSAPRNGKGLEHFITLLSASGMKTHQIRDLVAKCKGGTWFTNGYLARYAQHLAARIGDVR